MESIKKNLNESWFNKKAIYSAPNTEIVKPYNGHSLESVWHWHHPEWDKQLVIKAAELENGLTNKERELTDDERKDIERKVTSEFPFNKTQGDFVSSTSDSLLEQKLKSIVKGVIRETIEGLDGFSQYEEKGDDSDDEPKPLKKSENGKADFNDETSEDEERRSSVEAFFKDPHRDIATYAYDLDGIKPKKGEDTNEMKNSRSLFVKKLNHELNDDGYPYSFSTAEINRLFSLISSSNSLSESIDKAVKLAMKKVLK